MIKYNKITAQFFFWLLMIGVQFVFVSHIVAFPKSLLLVANTTVFTALLLYINIFYLYPTFHNSANNIRFNITSILIIIFFAVAHGVFEAELFQLLEVSPPARFKYPIVASIMKSVFWLTLVHLTSTIYLLQEGLRKNSEETKVIVEQKLNTELKYLKAQINPHFLFNALNNIYSLSYMKSDKGPDAVLKLSGMLRYVLEDCQADLVRLNSEIEYIENFIDFQQMKSQNSQNIEFNHLDTNGTVQVAPMLFISFIENSFKYSKIENTEGAYVKMKLETRSDCVCFELVNSIPEKGKAQSGSGKGIENTKHRLQILYPKNHTLECREEGNEYLVKLRIDL